MTYEEFFQKYIVPREKIVLGVEYHALTEEQVQHIYGVMESRLEKIQELRKQLAAAEAEGSFGQAQKIKLLELSTCELQKNLAEAKNGLAQWRNEADRHVRNHEKSERVVEQHAAKIEELRNKIHTSLVEIARLEAALISWRHEVGKKESRISGLEDKIKKTDDAYNRVRSTLVERENQIVSLRSTNEELCASLVERGEERDRAIRERDQAKHQVEAMAELVTVFFKLPGPSEDLVRLIGEYLKMKG